MAEGYFKHQNSWALILGGSSGMGLAIAKKMGEEGMNLCIVHRDRRKAQQLFEEQIQSLRQAEISIITFNVDALREDKRQTVLKEMSRKMGGSGRIKLLVHSISRGNLKPISTIEKEHIQSEEFPEIYQQLTEALKPASAANISTLASGDFEQTLYAMAISLYDWVKLVHNAKLFAEDSRVIGLTSEGSQKAWRSYAAVSAAKSVLESICRSIALEFAPSGIRCNVVQPGVTITPSLRMIPGHKHLIGNALLRNPFSRLTTPEDVANVVYLLSRKESAWINGAIIPVDGGEKNS